MDTLDSMRTFVTVVNEGSFSGAAERLDRSPQLVSKYVAQLEARLGVRLLNRTTRRVSITEAGQSYFEQCEQILAEIDSLEAAVGEMTASVRGTLRINAPMTFGSHHLTPAIAEFQSSHPEVRVDLTLDDRLVDIVSEGYDLAIRIGALKESTLIARPLAPVRRVVCGAPEYLERHGIPETPADLANHDCLVYTYLATRGRWLFESDSELMDIPVSGRFSANNGDAIRHLALAGHGLMLQPTFIIADDLRAGRLRTVLENYPIPAINAYAVYAHRKHLSAKVRSFVDFVGDYFGSPPYWDRGLDWADREAHASA